MAHNHTMLMSTDNKWDLRNLSSFYENLFLLGNYFPPPGEKAFGMLWYFDIFTKSKRMKLKYVEPICLSLVNSSILAKPLYFFHSIYALLFYESPKDSKTLRNKTLISTEGALRLPPTYEDHPIPSHPLPSYPSNPIPTYSCEDDLSIKDLIKKI